MTKKTFSDKMIGKRAVVCLVIVTVIILAIVFMSTSSGYCNCTGMATAFDRAPYTFWRGADYSWPLHPEMPFEKSGIQRLGSAYGPSENTVRDLIRDKQDGLLGPSLPCCRNDIWPSENRSRLVPLQAVGGRLPPGAVEYNRTSQAVAPIGTFRFGGYGTAAETAFVENAYGDVPRYCDLNVGVE